MPRNACSTVSSVIDPVMVDGRLRERRPESGRSDDDLEDLRKLGQHPIGRNTSERAILLVQA